MKNNISFVVSSKTITYRAVTIFRNEIHFDIKILTFRIQLGSHYLLSPINQANIASSIMYINISGEICKVT